MSAINVYTNFNMTIRKVQVLSWQLVRKAQTTVMTLTLVNALSIPYLFFFSFIFFLGGGGGGGGRGEIEWREGRWGGKRVVQQAHIFIPHPAFSNFTLKRLILKAAEKNQIWNRMTASVLKQDPNTKRFKRTLIYYDTSTQYAHFWGSPLCQATNWHWNNR